MGSLPAGPDTGPIQAAQAGTTGRSPACGQISKAGVARCWSGLNRISRIISLANRLRSVPSAKVARQVRGALNQGATDEQRIGLVTEVLDEAGITAPPPREPLPDIEKHEVRLVTWMAVKGTRGKEDALDQIPGTKL